MPLVAFGQEWIERGEQGSCPSAYWLAKWTRAHWLVKERQGGGSGQGFLGKRHGVPNARIQNVAHGADDLSSCTSLMGGIGW